MSTLHKKLKPSNSRWLSSSTLKDIWLYHTTEFMWAKRQPVLVMEIPTSQKLHREFTLRWLWDVPFVGPFQTLTNARKKGERLEPWSSLQLNSTLRHNLDNNQKRFWVQFSFFVYLDIPSGEKMPTSVQNHKCLTAWVVLCCHILPKSKNSSR